MDDLKKIDARDIRDGNFSWIQHELYTFFLPIVGREAAHLYMVLAFMIPARERSPVRYELTVRRIANMARMGKSTVQRELVTLNKTGMVPQIEQGPDRTLFLLGDLPELAKQGTAEIARRIGLQWDAEKKDYVPISVPQGDKGAEGGGSGSPTVASPANAESRAASDDADEDGAQVPVAAAKAPAGSGGGSVPQGDRDGVASNSEEKAGFSTLSGLLLSQKVGGLVPETGGSCPTEGGVLSQRKDALIKAELIQSFKTPLTPASGGDLSSPLRGVLDASREGSKSGDEEQGLPGEGEAGRVVTPAAKLAAQLVWATAQLMHRHGFANERRIEDAIAEALEWRCSTTSCTVAEAVEQAKANYDTWLRDSNLMTHGWGWRWWFQRRYCFKPEVWPYDRQQLRQRQHAQIGMSPGT